MDNVKSYWLKIVFCKMIKSTIDIIRHYIIEITAQLHSIIKHTMKQDGHLYKG